MLIVIHLPPATLRILAALVNFGVAIGCVIYIRIAARDMRWSRTNKRFVTRDPQPEVFWFKFVFSVMAIAFTFVLGVLLLFPPASQAPFLNIQLPKLESGKSH